MTFIPRTAQDLALEFPPGIDHLSATGLKMFSRCPEQWRRRYALGEKQRPALALAWGDADHKAIEQHFVAKRDTGEGLPVNEVKERFVAALEERVANDGGLDEMERREDEDLTKSFDKARTLGQELVACYHQGPAQFLMPSKIEHQFSISVPGQPVTVDGFIDYVVRDFHPMTGEVGGNERLLDRKTAARSKRAPEPDWIVQARMYQLEVPLPHEWQISIKTLEPKVQVDPKTFTIPLFPRETTLRWIERQVSQIGHLYMRYGPDQEWPGAGLAHPWACQWCGWRDTCAWH